MSMGGVNIEGGGSGKTLAMTEYDKHRTPHKAITDDTEITLTTRTLANELHCPICLDLLTNTMTAKECLHRFCCECITTALLRGNKECPTCRKKLVSKRSLRSDPNFDALINKIWPDRAEYEAMEQRSMQRFNRTSNLDALQHSIRTGMEQQALNRNKRVMGSYDYEKRKRRRKAVDDPESHGGHSSDRESTPGSIVAATSGSLSTLVDEEAAIIEFRLKPAKECLASQWKCELYVSVAAHATCEHVCKYLEDTLVASAAADDAGASAPAPAGDATEGGKGKGSEKPEKSSSSAAKQHPRPKLSIRCGDAKPAQLTGDLTLEEVRMRHWPDANEPLELLFSI